MVTNSNSVTLDYHTDGDGWSRGWSLAYSTHSESQKVTMQNSEEDRYPKIIFKITQSVVDISD